MALLVLVPGADGRAWYWHRVTPLLRDRGHEVTAVDLPVTDPEAGLDEYAGAVLDAIGNQSGPLVLVAQSLAGFVAPVVADRVPTALLILLNAMVPAPGESFGRWWENTGQAEARAAHYAEAGLPLPAEFDPLEAFFHDAPAEVVQEAIAMGEQPARFDTLSSQPWPLQGWPATPTRVLQGRDDRFFPLAFQRRVARARLGMELEEIPGGHLAALSRPDEVAQRIAWHTADAVPGG